MKWHSRCTYCDRACYILWKGTGDFKIGLWTPETNVVVLRLGCPISRRPSACQKVDKYGFTLVKLNRLMKRSTNSFVFPVQALKYSFHIF